MFPSSTVENYLKAIYTDWPSLTESDGKRLVPMGRLAHLLGVLRRPGTATTMVKALAESGLVTYLSRTPGSVSPSAGQKLAALVLRRHRLMELFLVQVLGMSWDEVHDEAERLEHAASDRVIDRIDAMLGRPSADPHGDPIPDPEGTVAAQEYHTLLTCPVGAPVVMMRVTDQDAEFLRFLESSDLKPGQTVRVEVRDSAADQVVVRGKNDRQITIGMRAAAKLQVAPVDA